MGRTTTYAYDADNGRLLPAPTRTPQENVAFTYTPTGRRETATRRGRRATPTTFGTAWRA